jgi:ADP-heptose:LPS heptosyltransferase
VKLAEIIFDSTKRKTVLMGAQWDSAYAAMVKRLDVRNCIHNFVGKTTISEALGLLREASFLVGFLSGLVILATRFKIPCVSFWPTLEQAPHWYDPEKFQMSWVPPNAKKSGYMPIFYGENKSTPRGVFDRLRRYL